MSNLALSPEDEKIYDSKSMDLRDSVAGLAFRLRVALVAELDRELSEDPDAAAFEITSAQYSILVHLLKTDVQSACELCEKLDYDRGAMSRMIDRLESKGLIRRVPLAHTRRGFALEVTAEGKAVFPKMEDCASRVLNRMLRGVTRTQVRTAEKVLRQMLANC
jgi:DNA-binding MarR family transcriptional regulator